MSQNERAKSQIDRLIEIMARLRDPDGGCPWDVEQSFATIAPYTIEEAYEVADAIQRNDMAALEDELGDLLLQVVFHAQMAREAGAFGFEDVARRISDKMVSRHPHVFGDGAVKNAEAQTAAWEMHKERERRDAAESEGRRHSALDGVALGLPALLRALKLQRRAARVGFDWSDLPPVIDKIMEELGELRTEIAGGASRDRLQDELGDILFAVANLARHFEIDPEAALRGTNDKFVRRFRKVEDALALRGRSPAQSDLAEMDQLWNEIKATEKS